jgi:hypothetical protein
MPNPFKIDAHVHIFASDRPLIDNPRHAPTYSHPAREDFWRKRRVGFTLTAHKDGDTGIVRATFAIKNLHVDFV